MTSDKEARKAEIEKGRKQARQDKRDAKDAKARAKAAEKWEDPLDEFFGPVDG